MHRVVKSIDFQDEPLQREVNLKRFKITNLERLYDNGSFRRALNIEFDPMGKLVIRSEPQQLKTVLSRVVNDIVQGGSSGVNSRTLNNSKAIENYVSRLGTLKERDDKETDGASQFVPIPGPRPSRRSKALIPKDVEIALTAQGVSKRLAELKNLDAEKYPMAALDSLRSLLECSLKAYCDAKGLAPKRRGTYVYLDSVCEAVEEHLDQTGPDQNKGIAQALRRFRSKTVLFSDKADLDSVNHNPYIVVTKPQVKETWESLEDVLRHILSTK